MRKSLQLLVTTPDGQQQQQKQRKLDVSLTGFQGTEKAAIIHLIGSMGGMYHDHMSHTNTHLVCKETATGLKLQKAIEWKLHIVSVQWLYRILQYGYNGITSNDDDIEDLDPMKGCEGKFSLV
jgi:NAD-dependent DNA ligase